MNCGGRGDQQSGCWNFELECAPLNEANWEGAIGIMYVCTSQRQVCSDSVCIGQPYMTYHLLHAPSVQEADVNMFSHAGRLGEPDEAEDAATLRPQTLAGQTTKLRLLRTLTPQTLAGQRRDSHAGYIIHASCTFRMHTSTIRTSNTTFFLI